MDAFITEVASNPLKYIEYVLAFCGALGILLFIAGWGSGMPHLFTYGESADHMDHARARAVWGILLCMVTLGIWEIIRVVLGQASAYYLFLSLLLLTPLWIPWFKGLFSGGGH